MALLTAAVLTPTDAALGQSVVSSPDVPERLGQRINVKSGLNDGLALPFVPIGAILAAATMGVADTERLMFEALTDVILGPIAAAAVRWALARAMDAAQNRDTMNEAAGAVVFLCAAFAAPCWPY